MIKLLLLDFDCSLTASHTTGALCFANNHYDHHLPAEFDRIDERVFSSNNASRDARFLFDILLQLVENDICVSIVTMSDILHTCFRQKQLTSEQLMQEYKVLAGKALVLRWLYCIACRAHNYDCDAAEMAIEKLFKTNRFHIVAKFNEKSKQQHFIESVSYFNSVGTLDANTLQPNEIGYADDSMPFLADMEKHYPGIGTFWISQGGITKKVWHEIAEKFNISFLITTAATHSETELKPICRTMSALTISSTSLTVK